MKYSTILHKYDKYTKLYAISPNNMVYRNKVSKYTKMANRYNNIHSHRGGGKEDIMKSIQQNKEEFHKFTERVKGNVEDLINQHQRNKEDLNLKDEDLTKCKNNVEFLKGDLAKAEKLNRELKTKIEENENTIQKNRKEIQEKYNEIQAVQKKIEELKRSSSQPIDDSGNKLKECEAKLATLNLEHAAKINDLNREREVKIKEIEASRNAVQEKVNAFTAKITEMEERNKQLTNEFNTINGQMKEKLTQIKNAYDSKINKLKKDLEEARQQEENARQREETVRRNNLMLDTKILELEKQKEELHKVFEPKDSNAAQELQKLQKKHEGELGKLNDELRSANLKNIQGKTSMEDMKQDIIDKQNKVQELEKQIKSLQGEQAEKLRRLTQEHQQTDEGNRKIEELTKTIKQNEEKIKSIEIENRKLIATNIEINERLANIEGKNNEEKNKMVESFEKTNQQLLFANAKLKKTIEKNQNTIETLTRENDMHTGVIKGLKKKEKPNPVISIKDSEEYKTLEEERNDLFRIRFASEKMYNEKLSEYKLQILDYERNIANLKGEREQCKRELEEIKKRIDELIKDHTIQTKTLQERHTRELNDLRNEIQEIRNQNQSLTKSNNESQVRINELQSINNELMTNITNNAKMHKTKQQEEQFKQNISSVEKYYMDLLIALTSLSSQISSLKSEIIDKKITNDYIIENITKLNGFMEKTIYEINILNKQLLHRDEKIIKIQDVIKNYQNDIDKIDSDDVNQKMKSYEVSYGKLIDDLKLEKIIEN